LDGRRVIDQSSQRGSGVLTAHIEDCQYDEVPATQRISECCSVLDAPLDQLEAEQTAAALRVLADPARLRLVSLIAAQNDGEACVCNLTAPLGLSQPTVSHHLKVLHESGVLDREQRGRWVYYRVRPETLERVGSIFAARVG
jgi:ArsR family transcriptional regulator